MKLLSVVVLNLLLLGKGISLEFQAEAQPKNRHYYIAALEVIWDYAPSGYNQYEDIAMTEGVSATYLTSSDALIGSKYKKAKYFEYTDDTFKQLKETAAWQGNLGPTIRAEVGDTITVTFKNMATKPFSIHPHGVKYTKESEGVFYKYNRNKASTVKPGETVVYEWEVPERAGPASKDGDVAMWMYHSHHDEIKDVYSGLAGALLVYRQGMLNTKTSMPHDVDKEFVLLYQVTNENLSHYLDENCKLFGCNKEDADFEESNLMHSINGRVYGNLEGLEMQVGERVRWLIAAFGTEVDLHTSHWHGNVLTMDEKRTDVIQVLPASTKIAIMEPDTAGVWLVHCHVNDHMTAGMIAYYTVNARDRNPR